MSLLRVGDPAPSFTVKCHTGELVRLADLEGKQFVLWFYPKADTPGDTLQGCSFRDHQKELDEKGAVVFGVSFDSVEENRAFAAKHHFAFRLLCDSDREIGMAYGACEDSRVGFAKRISYIVGEDGRVKAVWPKVDVKSHVADVLKAL